MHRILLVRPLIHARLAAVLWAALMVGGITLAGEEVGSSTPAAKRLQSGPRVGDKVPTFYVRAVTGPLKNKSVCYVCRNGDRPVVMLFIRQITPELKQLLRAI